MNNVSLIGNLTRDPELRYTTGENQTATVRLTVAVNDGYGDKQQTYFISVTAFGKTAENCEKFLAKGKKVAVSGKIRTGSYTNKEGVKVYTTDVVANSVEFLSPSSGSSETTGGGSPAAQPAPDGQQVEGFVEMKDDDIPF